MQGSETAGLLTTDLHDLRTDACACWDMGVFSAARLTSTFPYVTAMPVPSAPDLPQLHYADAGYFDSNGTFTALRWLQGVRETLAERADDDTLSNEARARARDAAERPVTFLVLDPFPTPKPKRTAGRVQATWFGPPALLLRARQVIQGVRNREDLGRMRTGDRHTVCKMRPPKGEELPVTPPMSWSLSDLEIRQLDDALDDHLQADLARAQGVVEQPK